MTTATEIRPEQDFEAFRRPIVTARDGEVFANSRHVAAFFGKEHYNVLRDIDALLGHASELRDRHFTLVMSPHPTISGRTDRSFDLTRDGFSLLAMGFTGAKALKFKMAYIDQFNAMEAELIRTRATARFHIPATLGEALQLAADQAKRIEAQDTALALAAPKVEAFDALLATDGLIGLMNAGRQLGCGPQKFVDWLKTQWLFYQGDALVPYARFLEDGLFVVKTQRIDERPPVVDGGGFQVEPARPALVVPRTFLTPKGLDYFRTRIPDSIRNISRAA